MPRIRPLSRRRILAHIPLIAAAGFASSLRAAEPPEQDIADMAADAVATGVPPALGMIAIENGRLGTPSAFGVEARGRPSAASATGRWHIGSNAKSMTATMVARLVEQGLLDWKASLADLLPDVPMREDYRAVTLPDLLSHRAGLARNSAAGLAAMPDDDPRSEQERRRAYAAAALTEPPVGPIAAGAGSYSNTGFLLAGLIAERATGLPFEALMRRELFVPLGMTSVGFGGTPPGEIAGHSKGGPVYGAAGDNPDFLRPAGGLHLSLADWGSYILDQMRGQRGEGRLLRAESYHFLHRPQPGSNNGLGWGLEAAPGGKPMWSHDGSNGRWFGIVAVLPDEQRAAMVVANAAGAEVEAVVNRMIVRTLGLA